MIKLLIIEKQKLLVNILQNVIEEDAIKIVGCAQTCAEAYQLCDSLLPDVVLMDIKNPEYDEMAGLKRIKSKHGAIKVLILTMLADVYNIREVLGNDVDGYLLKDIPLEGLTQAIKNVYYGFGIVKSSKKYQVIRQPIDCTQEKSRLEKLPHPYLKDQELTLIRLIAEGKSNRQIAAIIFLSEGRVKNMLTELFGKLNVKSRYELLSYAYKHDLVG